MKSKRFWGLLSGALILAMSTGGAAGQAAPKGKPAGAAAPGPKARPAKVPAKVPAKKTPAPGRTASPAPRRTPVPTPLPASPTPTASPSPTPEPAVEEGRIPRSLRGKDRVQFMLAHWQELAGPDLGEFAFAHMTPHMLHQGQLPLSMPLPVAKALPVLFPDRYRAADFADYGFLPDPSDPDGLPVGFKTGPTSPRYVGITCAACHVGLVRDAQVAGAANSTLRYGDFMLAWEKTLADPGLHLDAVRVAARQAMGPLSNADLAELQRWIAQKPRPPYRSDAERNQIEAWGAGRANYRGLGVPARFPPLWEMGSRFMSDGAWTNLAERNRYALWRQGAPLEALRAPDANRLFRALSEYLAGLEPPAGNVPERGLAIRGAEVYQAQCASCHDRPGDLLLVEQVGTDDRLAREDSPLEQVHMRLLGFEGLDVQFWPRIKIPALGGMIARKLLLHNGAVTSLETLLSPDRRPPILAHAGTVFDTRLPGHSNRGHTFGADLEPDDRAGLLAYLRSL